MCGGELDVDREAERAREEQPVLRADRRPGDLDLLAVAARRDADEVRVVLRRRDTLLGHADPALGRDERRVDVVHDLVDTALESPVQRSNGQQADVVLGERARGR